MSGPGTAPLHLGDDKLYLAIEKGPWLQDEGQSKFRELYPSGGSGTLRCRAGRGGQNQFFVPRELAELLPISNAHCVLA